MPAAAAAQVVLGGPNRTAVGANTTAPGHHADSGSVSTEGGCRTAKEVHLATGSSPSCKRRLELAALQKVLARQLPNPAAVAALDSLGAWVAVQGCAPDLLEIRFRA